MGWLRRMLLGDADAGDDYYDTTAHFHVCPNCGEMWSHVRDEVRGQDGVHICPREGCGGQDFMAKWSETKALKEQKAVHKRRGKKK